MHNERDNSHDLLFVNFSNEIDDLPPPNTYKRKMLVVPKEIEKELERTKEAKEGEFRKWLIKHKPRNAVMTPIETSTSTGVPDLFCCHNGFSSWIECKICLSGGPRIRGTQYSYLKKLIEAGGHAKIVIQKLSPKTYKPAYIDIYDAAKIVAIPIGMFKQQGQNVVFPPNTSYWYRWAYDEDKRKGETIEDLYLKLLLDIEEFI